jgi:L-lysine exporter family protein LysE/ArgO
MRGIGTGGLHIFMSGAWLGLSAAAPIGPVNVELARRTLRGGFGPGFALGCGAVTADITYAVLASMSLSRAVAIPYVKWPIAVVGLIFMAWLGGQSLRAAYRHLRVDPLADAVDRAGAHRSYFTGLAMTLLNPFTLVFWFVAVPSAGALTSDPHHELPMICAGVFVGTIGWVIFFAGVLSAIGRYRRPWWLAAADALGGAMLLALVAGMVWRLSRD